MYRLTSHQFQSDSQGFGNQLVQAIQQTNWPKLLNLGGIFYFWQKCNEPIINSSNVNSKIEAVIKRLDNICLNYFPTTLVKLNRYFLGPAAFFPFDLEHLLFLFL
jgi:hypothetical protein